MLWWLCSWWALKFCEKPKEGCAWFEICGSRVGEWISTTECFDPCTNQGEWYPYTGAPTSIMRECRLFNTSEKNWCSNLSLLSILESGCKTLEWLE